MTNAAAQLSEDGRFPDGTFRVVYKDEASEEKEITLKQIHPIGVMDFFGNTFNLRLDKIVSLTQTRKLPDYLVDITRLLFDISSLASLMATDISAVSVDKVRLEKYFELDTVTKCISEKIKEVGELSDIVEELID